MQRRGEVEMKTFEDFINYQRDFDKKHFGKFDWGQKIDDENIDILEFLLISILGELGETSNIVKKVLRGDATLQEMRPSLNEEITDIFIYLLKLIYQLDIDIAQEYLSKMQKNEKRFSKFEIQE